MVLWASGCALRAPVTSEPAPAVVGFVADGQTGVRIAGARVLVLGLSRAAETDAAGQYVLRELRPGQLSIAAVAPGCRAAIGRITIAAGELRRVDLHVLPWSPGEFEQRFPAADPNRDGAAVIRVFEARDFERTSAATLAEFLQHAVPEMVSFGSGQAGAPPTLRGRAPSTRAESLVPLIIVNGILLGGGEAAPGDRTNIAALLNIPTREVQRVEILRGASSSALYGTGGAAGVIRIYTLRGDVESWETVPSGFCPRPARR